MTIARRVFVAGAMMMAFAVSAGTSFALEIRYFVVQSAGLFEIRGISTGGRFVNGVTGERLNVPGYGTLAVCGYTDRAQRGETVVTQVKGYGSASIDVTYTPQGGSRRSIFSGYLQLPVVAPRTVSLNTSFDNLNVTAGQYGRTISRRLPIGTRP